MFGDKVIDHLRMFLDPERLMLLRLWREEEGSENEQGVEEKIASNLLGLLHLLPWQPNTNIAPTASLSLTSSPKEVLLTFITNLLAIVRDLDVVWRNFRPESSSLSSSPFIPPVAKFLSRYPAEAIQFFISHEKLLDEEVLNFLYCLFDLYRLSNCELCTIQ